MKNFNLIVLMLLSTYLPICLARRSSGSDGIISSSGNKREVVLKREVAVDDFPESDSISESILDGPLNYPSKNNRNTLLTESERAEILAIIATPQRSPHDYRNAWEIYTKFIFPTSFSEDLLEKEKADEKLYEILYLIATNGEESDAE